MWPSPRGNHPLHLRLPKNVSAPKRFAQLTLYVLSTTHAVDVTLDSNLSGIAMHARSTSVLLACYTLLISLIQNTRGWLVLLSSLLLLLSQLRAPPRRSIKNTRTHAPPCTTITVHRRDTNDSSIRCGPDLHGHYVLPLVRECLSLSV